MKVINLFAGPGAGKSTTASGLFFRMKCAGKRVELVTEYAKDLVYEGNYVTLRNQAEILKEQDHRQRRLLGQVDYAVTDSPLLLGLAYVEGHYNTHRMREKIKSAFSTYDNVNFFIRRIKPYADYGREQREDRARRLDAAVRDILAQNNYRFVEIDGDASAPDRIMELL